MTYISSDKKGYEEAMDKMKQTKEMTHSHNPEIEKYLDKLNDLEEYGGCDYCRYSFGRWTLCYDCSKKKDECKSIIKGIIIAQENEIEFLEGCELVSYTGYTVRMRERITQLKISNEELKKIQ